MADLKINDELRELALFAGAGGGILGGHLLGWRTICAVERDPYAASVLVARQNDGLLPAFPIWDDVRTFDGKPWRGIVDVVSGGFPCQDISVAGNGDGINGERSGLWRHMARIIGDVRPRFVFVENSPMLAFRGLGRVLGDLAEMGYDAKWCVLGADDTGAPHIRKRIWVLAYAFGFNSNTWRTESARQQWSARAADGSDDVANANSSRKLQSQGAEYSQRRRTGDSRQELGYTDRSRLEVRQGQRGHTRQELPAIERASWWTTEPDVGRVANGVAARVDKLRAIGNGQVPSVAAAAWRILTAV